jgi:hypothetical protein
MSSRRPRGLREEGGLRSVRRECSPNLPARAFDKPAGHTFCQMAPEVAPAKKAECTSHPCRCPVRGALFKRGRVPGFCLTTAVSAYTAVGELVKEPLRDPSVREEIIAIVSSDRHESVVTQVAESEPPVDANGAARLLSMTVAAVRSAAYRGTLRSHHVGRRLRFRPSELLPERKG